MRGKKAKKAREIIYTGDHSFRDRKHYWKPDTNGKPTRQVVADELRQAYQNLKRLMKGHK